MVIYDVTQEVYVNYNVNENKLTLAAPAGTEDTQNYYNKEIVNFGSILLDCIENIMWNNGRNM